MVIVTVTAVVAENASVLVVKDPSVYVIPATSLSTVPATVSTTDAACVSVCVYPVQSNVRHDMLASSVQEGELASRCTSSAAVGTEAPDAPPDVADHAAVDDSGVPTQYRAAMPYPAVTVSVSVTLSPETARDAVADIAVW